MITLDITLNVVSPRGTIKENYKRITDDFYTMTTGFFLKGIEQGRAYFCFCSILFLVQMECSMELCSCV